MMGGRRGSSPKGGNKSPSKVTADMLYGIAPVEGALKAGRRRLERLYLKTGRASPRLAALRELAAGHGLTVSEADAPELERLSGAGSHQGAVLRCGSLPPRTEAECLALGKVGQALLVFDMPEALQ